jgi:hypothetical protein
MFIIIDSILYTLQFLLISQCFYFIYLGSEIIISFMLIHLFLS